MTPDFVGVGEGRRLRKTWCQSCQLDFCMWFGAAEWSMISLHSTRECYGGKKNTLSQWISTMPHINRMNFNVCFDKWFPNVRALSPKLIPNLEHENFLKWWFCTCFFGVPALWLELINFDCEKCEWRTNQSFGLLCFSSSFWAPGNCPTTVVSLGVDDDSRVL